MSTCRDEYLLGVFYSYLLSVGLSTQDLRPLLPAVLLQLSLVLEEKDLQIIIVFNKINVTVSR